MQISLPRREILRQARAHVGIQTNSALASQEEESQIVKVQAAALKVAQDCRWVSAQDRQTITIGAEQNRINYPDNCGPGAVLSIAVYDQNRYWPLEQRIIPVAADQDQEQAAGGDTFKMVQGRPRYFQSLAQIAIWPYTDKEYPLRVEFMRPMNLPTDDSMSVVDGQLVIYAAAALLAEKQGDTELKDSMWNLYHDRLTQLRGWQSAGTRFPMNSEADLAEGEFTIENILPSWDRGPTIRPNDMSPVV